MASYVWPSDDGWPYPDTEGETIDFDGSIDDDVLSLRATPAHLFDGLDPLERAVIASRYGLDGGPARSMKQLQTELGVPRSDLRQALGSGLAKLRVSLAD